jgi:hypothetical protein
MDLRVVISSPIAQRSSTMTMQQRVVSFSIGALVTLVAGPALADCNALPGFSELRSAKDGDGRDKPGHDGK